MDSFHAMNECQDHAVHLARAHVERLVLEAFHRASRRAEQSEGPEIRSALDTLSDLYALSRLTARTAFGVLVVPYTWFFLQPRSQELVLSWPYTVGFSVLAVLAFLLPLLGIHSILQREKLKLQAETSRRLEAAIRSLHEEADAGNLAVMDGLNKLLASLALEQAAIDRISTWPWQPETPRLVATAVLTPLLVYLGQRMLAAVLGL